jgi:competence protein ComEC
MANSPDLAAWARPRVVVSCQGPPRGPANVSEPYTARGARYLGTWPHGAITVRSHASGLVIETYLTRERMVVR